MSIVQYNVYFLFTESVSDSDSDSELFDCPGKDCNWKNEKQINRHFNKISDIIDNLRSSLTSFEPNNNVVHRRQFENHLKSVYPSFKIDHSKRRVWEVVKILGSTTSPNCTFKY
jgi:hypothetical protein